MISIRALPLALRGTCAARLDWRRLFAWRRAWAILLFLVSWGGQSLAQTAPSPIQAASAQAGAQAPAVQAEAGVSAIAARIDRRGATTRLIFELTGPTTASAFAATGPRIVVDLPEVAFLIDPAVGAAAPTLPRRSRAASAEADASLIRSFRFGRFAPGRSRIVIDLTRPARAARVESVLRPEGARLEIDLVHETPAAFAAAVAQRLKALSTSPEPSAPPTRSPGGGEPGALPLVVIDPGHGGVDIGASSRRGQMEKAIVFDFARALKTKIEARGKQRVMLTREDDIFVPLNDRVRFARERGASLFLSIHADTLGQASVRGATVYTVAARASDAESARIAEKENLADQAAGVEDNAKAEEVGDILFDLARRETRALGREFAHTLLAKWREAGSLNKNPSRSASFVVLKAHDVPSALLELGYLSSEEDLANLTSPAWRDRAAEGVAEAIETYFQAHAPPSRASSK